MGQLNINTHWEKLILPFAAAFEAAEIDLTNAYISGDGDAVRAASYECLRLGMSAAIFVYHFHEVVLDRRSLQPQPVDLAAMRTLISDAVRNPNGDAMPQDHNILGEVANAVKHAELRDKKIVHVSKKGRVLAVTENPTQVVEGKRDGTPQVVVLSLTGERSLQAVVENVLTGWRRLAGMNGVALA